jgi:SAM-dependent methyltransferase
MFIFAKTTAIMPTSQTQQHYETHLGEYYSWMFGGIDDKTAEHKELFESLQLKPQTSGIAIDLGAGNGIQSIPLTELGYKVFAVDFSRKLLDELEAIKKDLPIEIIEADILHFNSYAHLQPELFVCMGDTLPHLSAIEDVRKLFQQVYNQLQPRGRFIISFRNLMHELKDSERFIPVRSDNDTIFTCFLEYFDDYVKVHDIIHKLENGAWKQKISVYKKLRLSGEIIMNMLQECNFKIASHSILNGMQLIVAEKENI